MAGKSERIRKTEIARMRRAENSYLVHLIRVLLPYDARGLPRSVVLERVRGARKANGFDVPANFQSSVRRAFRTYNSGSESFAGAPDDDLFFQPDGTDRWAIHRKPALAWLRKQSFRV